MLAAQNEAPAAMFPASKHAQPGLPAMACEAAIQVRSVCLRMAVMQALAGRPRAPSSSMECRAETAVPLNGGVHPTKSCAMRASLAASSSASVAIARGPRSELALDSGLLRSPPGRAPTCRSDASPAPGQSVAGVNPMVV